MSVLKSDNNKILNIRPLCIIAVCFLFGINCCYAILKRNYTLAFLPLIIFCLLFLIRSIVKRKQSDYSLIFFLCCLVIFGFGALNTYFRVLSVERAGYYNAEGGFYGRVVEIRECEHNLYRIVFDNCKLNGEKLGGKCVSYVYDYYLQEEVVLGGEYSFNCTIQNRYLNGEVDSDIFSGNFFNLRVKEKISFEKDGSSIFQKVHAYLKRVFKNDMQADNASIALALITGDTSEISYSSLQNYKIAGIAHIFAVSGLHVGTLATFLSLIFKRLKMKRWHIFFATVIPVTLYCGVCGFSDSSLRALIMSALILLSNCLGFKRDTLSAIAVSAIVITAINPMAIYEVGFRLSFTAVISIVILSPVFLRGANKNKTLGEPLSVAISAQLGTLPILADMSGYTSIITLFANLFFVPVVMFIFQFLLVSTVFACVEFALFSSVNVSLFISDKLIYAIDFLVNAVGFEKFVIPVKFGSLAIIYYLGLTVVSDVVNLEVKQKIAIGALCAGVTLFLSCV